MLYDISQLVFECETFPGDPSPKREMLSSIKTGDLYNLTAFSMCAHNGTHVDAPLHFIKDGKGIGEILLEKFIGKAYVASHDGEISAQDAEMILNAAATSLKGSEKRILIRGTGVVNVEAAKVFAESGIDLIGSESQTVGPKDSPMAVHLVLLGAEVVLLEGLRLGHVPDGAYLLNCAPLNLGVCDGAPCRATLMDII